MQFAAGTKLGAYEILSAIGAGGMGEVYRARDTRLKRDVALKVLPDSVTHDFDRLARFQREAEVLASLNHPHIAQIHGLEDSNGIRALVLEFVDGPTLADRIAQGSIPIEEALPIARQIAEALEAAHEHGIIHRDLKPANVKVRADGTVKVLDFGLAKAIDPSPSSGAALANSPTLTSPAMMTGVSVILGTAAYMSPEQAKGRGADKRSDVWAFGCVLYEMLTAKRAFEGEDVSETLAAVLRAEPDWNALPVDLPATIRALVQQCLVKDPRERLNAIGTALFLMRVSLPTTGTQTVPIVVSRHSRWRVAAVAAITALAIGAGGAALGWRYKPRPLQGVVRFSIPLGEGQSLTSAGRGLVAVSPDGTRLAYVANRRLYVRDFSAAEAKPIGGNDLGLAYSPVFSPDSQSVAFVSEPSLPTRTLKRIAVSGGEAVTICPLGDAPFGISWSDEGIVFAHPRGISRVSATVGEPELLVANNAGDLASNPQLLPGGRVLLFTVGTPQAQPDRWDKAKIVVRPLDSADQKTVIEGGNTGRYVPSGHLLYAVSGVVFAAPFNLKSLAVTGRALPIIEGVSRASGGNIPAIAQFSVSATGLLAYVAGPIGGAFTNQDLQWVDRTGAIERLNLPGASYATPRISPNGRQLAFATDDGRDANIWILDLGGSVAPRRLTFGGQNRFPTWSADGERVAFQSDREGDRAIFSQKADGTGLAERLTKPDSGTSHIPSSWAPDGKWLLFTVLKGERASLWTFSARERRAEPFGAVESNFLPNAVFSPDRQWVVYVSGEAPGSQNVFVQPFPATGVKYQVSRSETSGVSPMWSSDGTELFYARAPGDWVVVRVTTKPSFSTGNPTPVPPGGRQTRGPIAPRDYDIAPDGRRFLVIVSEQGPQAASSIRVVLNWFEELKARVPTR